jgi:arsenite transporter
VKTKKTTASVTQPIEDANKGLGFFERYLSIWVFLCIVIGVAIGQLIPAIPDTLTQFTYAEVNIPIAILIWFMIYPMMIHS